MGPHANYLDRLFLLQNLIDQPVLNVDAPGICAFHISQEFFKGRRPLPWIFCQKVQKLLGFRAQPRQFDTASVFLGLLGKDQLPRLHQPGSPSHSSTGAAIPSTIDSRIPGTERRCSVS